MKINELQWMDIFIVIYIYTYKPDKTKYVGMILHLKYS